MAKEKSQAVRTALSIDRRSVLFWSSRKPKFLNHKRIMATKSNCRNRAAMRRKNLRRRCRSR